MVEHFMLGKYRDGYELYPGVIDIASPGLILQLWREYAQMLIARGSASTTELAALFALRQRWYDLLGICGPCDDPTIAEGSC